MSKDYSKIREMLEAQETFPIDYIHKVIGRNTPAFLQSLAVLEGRFAAIRRESFRPSASQAHVAVTLILHAETVDDVISLLEATGDLQDLVLVL